MTPTVMDAGPLVAWFCPKDEHHAWAEKVFDELPTGALVCEAVLAEACHLTAKDGIAPAKVLQLVEDSSLALVSLAAEIDDFDFSRVAAREKANAPLFVHADAVLSRAVAPQGFQAVQAALAQPACLPPHQALHPCPCQLTYDVGGSLAQVTDPQVCSVLLTELFLVGHSGQQWKKTALLSEKR